MSSCLQARTGRDLQRYENHFRLVAGCIPYRIKQHAQTLKGDLLSKLEVLMITSPNRLDLVFPKGGWENDETMDEAASREALEEAGVLGIIHDTLLGVWEFRSKSKQKLCGQEGACRGYMFALEVTEELQCWPEQSTHDRKWLNVWEAWKLCRYDWMREALNSMAMLIAGKPVIMIAAAPEISSEESSSSSSSSSSSPSSLFFHVKPSAAECAIDSAINAFC